MRVVTLFEVLPFETFKGFKSRSVTFSYAMISVNHFYVTRLIQNGFGSPPKKYWVVCPNVSSATG